MSSDQLFTFGLVLKFIRILLFPFSVLYSIILRARHFLYDAPILKSHSFDIPTIGIGNLSFGGTGKSPFAIFLAKDLLEKGLSVAIVSRGYKRKTTGVVFCTADHSSLEIGDEPRMYVQNLPDISVVVAENRADGISALHDLEKRPDVILLDDCYQHRKINPKILFLLTQENSPYWKDYLVPSGYLRDIKWAAKRADALIITKVQHGSPITNTPKIWSGKNVFHSKIVYGTPEPLGHTESLSSSVVSFSALANDSLFLIHLGQNFTCLKSFSFSDHHQFTNSEIIGIIDYCNAQNRPISIITTQKDAARLSNEQIQLFKESNLYVLPISTPIVEEEKFNEYLKSSLGL